LFENFEVINEEDPNSSNSSVEEEIKHEDLDEGGPGVFHEDSLGSYNSEEAREEEEAEPDDEMDFDDIHMRHGNIDYGFGSDDDDAK
jgi:hypothetical protein